MEPWTFEPPSLTTYVGSLADGKEAQTKKGKLADWLPMSSSFAPNSLAGRVRVSRVQTPNPDPLQVSNSLRELHRAVQESCGPWATEYPVKKQPWTMCGLLNLPLNSK